MPTGLSMPRACARFWRLEGLGAILLAAAATLITPFGLVWCPGIQCQTSIEGVDAYWYDARVLFLVNRQVWGWLGCQPWGGREGDDIWLCAAGIP